METFADRLYKIRKEAKLTQVDLAKRAGLTQGVIAQIESGRNEGSKHILVIAQSLNVNPDWLATGKGNRTTSKKLHPLAQDILDSFDELPPALQTVALEQIKALIKASRGG